MKVLSVVAVNHNSSALLKECLFSIESALGDQSFEFLVIDSGSREEDVDNLRSLERCNVKMFLIKENIGYARAVNIGAGNARGDFILITNPDVLYKPESIGMMMDALSKLPRCGAVGPRTWWDRGMTFLLPFSEMVTPRVILRSGLMNAAPRAGEYILRRWVRKALRYWLSDAPVRQAMLSGASIMTTREVFERVGGFDEMFPLYFEDADWCLRARRAGYRLYAVPGAHVIHYHNQSAKQDIGISQAKYNLSQDRYLQKHFGGWLGFLNQIRHFSACRGDRITKRFRDRGVVVSPPLVTVGRGGKTLLLLSPANTLIPSAGAIFEGNSFAIPDELWGYLGDGRYFASAFELDSLDRCGGWTWEKKSPDEVERPLG